MFKLLRFLKPFRLFVFIVILLTIFQIGSELVLPTIMANIVDIGIVNGDMTYILRSGLFMLLVALIGVASSIIASYVSAHVSEGFGRSLRDQIYSKVEGLSLSTFQSLGTSSLITRTTNDVTQVQNFLQLMLRIMLLAPIMCIGGVIMALAQDVELSKVILVVIPLLAISIVLIIWKAMPLFKSMQRRIDNINSVVREGLSGIRVIRAFHRISWQRQRFNQANEAFRDTSIQVLKIMSLNLPVIMLAFNLSTVLILWFGTGRIINDGLQVGQLMAFIQYASMILLSVVLFSFIFGALPRAMASAARINELMDKSTEQEMSESAVTAKERIGDDPITVEYRDVSYEYPEAGNVALKNISFTTRQGEITAIIGRTGAGKTTLLNLLPRLYEPSSGTILINGVDSKNISLEQLRGMIGIVIQKAVLFSGSIRDNICYGSPDMKEAEVWQAAATAQAESFISGLTEGLDSSVSQGGTNLSGGQKQRLTIARALARKPRIYLFDDSFSALDYKTDAQLRNTLRTELSQAAVLIVAQRVRTVMDADRIIVLDEGEVVAIGNHYDLLQTSLVYQEIVMSQESGVDMA